MGASLLRDPRVVVPDALGNENLPKELIDPCANSLKDVRIVPPLPNQVNEHDKERRGWRIHENRPEDKDNTDPNNTSNAPWNQRSTEFRSSIALSYFLATNSKEAIRQIIGTPLL